METAAYWFIYACGAIGRASSYVRHSTFNIRHYENQTPRRPNKMWKILNYRHKSPGVAVVRSISDSIFLLPVTYEVHIRFIGKRVVSFLLVLIELFSLGATRLKRYGWKWIKKIGRRVSMRQIFAYKGTSPANHFCMDKLFQWTPYNVVAEVFTQINSVADFRFAYFAPLGGGGLGATYDDHLRLIGKRVVDFLLVLIELFFARYYGSGATSEYWFEISDFAPTETSWPKISGRRNRSPPTQPLFISENRLFDLSHGIKIWTDLTSALLLPIFR